MNDPPEKTTICAGCASFLRANASKDAYNEPAVEDSRWSTGHDGLLPFLCNLRMVCGVVLVMTVGILGEPQRITKEPVEISKSS